MKISAEEQLMYAVMKASFTQIPAVLKGELRVFQHS